ncbi:hypothetical protein ACF0H5_017342 [Mactra antiquata]
MSKSLSRSLLAQRNKRKQSTYSQAGSSSNKENLYKYTEKQTKSWKPINKQLKEYMFDLIDDSVRKVRSKSEFSDITEVQKKLIEHQSRLKNELENLQVPKRKYLDHTKLRKQTDELTEELEQLKTQELLLEKAIRQEEREIESLENMQHTVEENIQLNLKLPDEVLGLPSVT